MTRIAFIAILVGLSLFGGLIVYPFFQTFYIDKKAIAIYMETKTKIELKICENFKEELDFCNKPK